MGLAEVMVVYMELYSKLTLAENTQLKMFSEMR